MNQLVLIKSFQNGLNVVLDASISFDELLVEIEKKFSEAGKFFQDSRLALSIEGRELSSEEERIIVNVICETSGIDIVCLISKDESKNLMYLNAMNQITAKISPNNHGEFYHGSLTDGAVLESDTSLVIFGDVYPDCTVISAKDIIILGGLYGQAIAGGDLKDNHYVIALEMAPQKLKIGNFKYRTEKAAKWSIKPKIVPKMALIRNDKVVFEMLTKEILATTIRG